MIHDEICTEINYGYFFATGAKNDVFCYWCHCGTKTKRKKCDFYNGVFLKQWHQNKIKNKVAPKQRKNGGTKTKKYPYLISAQIQDAVSAPDLPPRSHHKGRGHEAPPAAHRRRAPHAHQVRGLAGGGRAEYRERVPGPPHTRRQEHGHQRAAAAVRNRMYFDLCNNMTRDERRNCRYAVRRTTQA